jgi:hypothetical protein
MKMPMGSGFGDFAGLDAARADAEALGCTVNERFDHLQVNVPAAAGDIVRVGYVVAETRALAADIASLCHGLAPDIQRKYGAGTTKLGAFVERTISEPSRLH